MKYMTSIILMGLLAAIANAGNLSIETTSYLEGGLFSNPLLPVEGEPVKIIIRAKCDGQIDDDIRAELKLIHSTGDIVNKEILTLTRNNTFFEATYEWMTNTNGLYTVEVTLDPENTIKESNEKDNIYTLVLPVVVKGRKLHFVWYRDFPELRWATCFTTAKPEQVPGFHERGIMALGWNAGGMSLRGYGKENAEESPEQKLKKFEERFYQRYTSPLKGRDGFGIDESGGYADTLTEKKSIASMKALIRAKREMPDRFFAVWHGGGIRTELTQYYRQACDLLLIETYVWFTMPHELGKDNIYQEIRDRLSPFIRGNDMIVPAYNNPCYTLMGLDTGLRPDHIDLGEQEQVVRFIRQICPEMRGLAWFNANYDNSYYQKGVPVKGTPELYKKHVAIYKDADRLCFEYFVKPCITLMQKSLWLHKTEDGKWELTSAVSNIGAIDSGSVRIEYFVDGKSVGTRTATTVPAGASRIDNRTLLMLPLKAMTPGMHSLSAKIVEAPGSTVLDGNIETKRWIPDN